MLSNTEDRGRNIKKDYPGSTTPCGMKISDAHSQSKLLPIVPAEQTESLLF